MPPSIADVVEASNPVLDASATSSVVSVAGSHPPHRYSQVELVAAIREYWGSRHHNPARLESLHRAVCVGGRHLALPIEEYPKLQGFGDANDAFIRVGTEVAANAVREALERAGLGPADIDCLLFTTVTGVAVPSIDARLINRLGMRTDVKRIPVFGLGCVAGAAGIARLHDYLLAYPDHIALLVSLELCSLTLQRNDLSIPNLIASGLFGDGAAAVVMAGSTRARRLGPSVGSSRVDLQACKLEYSIVSPK